MEKVKLPPHLAGYTPYLREYYGTVKHSVRQIYQGYLGWFQGDPVDLDPIPPAEKAKRLIALMGGRDKLLLAAGDAYLKGTGNGRRSWPATPSASTMTTNSPATSRPAASAAWATPA